MIARMWIEANGCASSETITAKFDTVDQVPSLEVAAERLKAERWPAFHEANPQATDVQIVVQLQRRGAMRNVRSVNW